MSKCIETGCKTVSCFGITKGEVLYCKKHKRAEMIDVKNRICNFEGCTTTCPAFGEKGGIGTHCKKHKSENMIDVKTKRCESTGCESLAPVFNLKGEKGEKKKKITGRRRRLSPLCLFPPPLRSRSRFLPQSSWSCSAPRGRRRAAGNRW